MLFFTELKHGVNEIVAEKWRDSTNERREVSPAEHEKIILPP